MKRSKFIIFTILCTFVYSCADFLDVVPDNVPTLEHAFLDRTSTEKYLATCYTYLPYLGRPADDPAILGSDEWWAIEDDYFSGTSGNFGGLKLKKGEQNTNNPYFNYWDGLNNGRAFFRALRDCNVFLENVLNVGGDLSDEEAKRWAAEVKVLKAYYHFYLLRMYGPIPLQKESLPVSTGIQDVRIYRDPFDECVDYIVSLLDEAVPDLPLRILNVSSELGRITQPIALALKAKVLVLAASPLFNGNPDYSNVVDNRGIELFSSEYDQTKWERAATACKNAIDTCLLAGHDLYEFTKLSNISDTTKLLLTIRQSVTEKWNKEIVWTGAHLTMNAYYSATIPYFTVEQALWIRTSPYMYPTLKMAELFYTKNGVPIDEDVDFDYAQRYNVSPAPADHKYYISSGYETANLNINREPRFYANLAFDGAVWFGNGRYRDIGDGNVNEQSWIIQTKRGQPQGKISSIRYSVSGYWVKKTSHFETVVTPSSHVVVRSTFPIVRLADLYLLYAEALNESLDTPNEEVYKSIDIVRKRAGLDGVRESWQNYSRYPTKPLTKEGLREIIQQERMIELAFEGKRYWDIRRWKTAHIWLNQPIQGLNADGTTTSEFNVVRTIYVPSFSTKDYLAPIREHNLRTNPNLVQNPYW